MPAMPQRYYGRLLPVQRLLNLPDVVFAPEKLPEVPGQVVLRLPHPVNPVESLKTEFVQLPEPLLDVIAHEGRFAFGKPVGKVHQLAFAQVASPVVELVIVRIEQVRHSDHIDRGNTFFKQAQAYFLLVKLLPLFLASLTVEVVGRQHRNHDLGLPQAIGQSAVPVVSPLDVVSVVENAERSATVFKKASAHLPVNLVDAVVHVVFPGVADKYIELAFGSQLARRNQSQAELLVVFGQSVEHKLVAHLPQPIGRLLGGALFQDSGVGYPVVPAEFQPGQVNQFGEGHGGKESTVSWATYPVAVAQR